MNPPAVFDTSLRECAQEKFATAILVEDRFAPVAAIHEVVHCAGILAACAPCSTMRTGAGQSTVLRLYSIAKTAIERHIKVKGEANPYDPIYSQYFERRRHSEWRTLPLGRTGQSLLSGV